MKWLLFIPHPSSFILCGLSGEQERTHHARPLPLGAQRDEFDVVDTGRQSDTALIAQVPDGAARIEVAAACCARRRDERANAATAPIADVDARLRALRERIVDRDALRCARPAWAARHD